MVNWISDNPVDCGLAGNPRRCQTVSTLFGARQCLIDQPSVLDSSFIAANASSAPKMGERTLEATSNFPIAKETTLASFGKPY